MAASPVGDIANFYTLLARGNFALAGAIAVSLLNRIDSAEVAAVYSLIEVPLLLSVAGAYHRWWTPPPLDRPASDRS
jgi:ACR3 family arsenite efflux pump ArsB